MTSFRLRPTGISAPVKLLETTTINEANHVSSALVSKGYRLGPTIGKGSYAKVKVAQRIKDGDIVAAKIISRHKAAKEFLRRFLPREISVLLSVKHPNIVQVFEVVQTHDFVCLIIEFAERGDLLSYVKKRSCLDEMEAKDIFYQIADAVRYLHGRSICHRDLKCENVLIRRGHSVAVTDFGFSKMVSHQHPLSDTYCGSAAYASPELLRGKPYNPFVTDVWSLGCVLFVTVSGQMPFYEKNTKKMLSRQLQGRVVYPDYCSVSRSCKDLVSKILEPNIDRRIDINGVLSHRWLGGQSSKFQARHNTTAGVHVPTSSAWSKLEASHVLNANHGTSDKSFTIRAEDDVGMQDDSKYRHRTEYTVEAKVDVDTSKECSRGFDHNGLAIRHSLLRCTKSSRLNKAIVEEFHKKEIDVIEKTSEPPRTPNYRCLNSTPQENFASDKAMSAQIALPMRASDSNKTHIATSTLHGTVHLDLAGPSRVSQINRSGFRHKQSTADSHRRIDPIFQKKIENILRLSNNKTTFDNPETEARHVVRNSKKDFKPVITIHCDGAYISTLQFQVRPRDSFSPESELVKGGVGKPRTAPENAKKVESNSTPFNHDVSIANNQRVEIASERFHSRQEGLVTQMRRIFESKDACTNTQTKLNRK